MAELTGNAIVDKALSLAHYGVKGQKWGVRRKRGPDGRVSKDHATSRQLKTKRLHELSNDDIRTLNTRLQLEKQYRDLNPNVVRKGGNILRAALGVGTSANNVMTFAASPAGQQVLRAALNDGQLERVNARLPIKKPKK